MAFTKSQKDPVPEGPADGKLGFGVYVIRDSARFHVLDNVISFERESRDKFSYRREGPSGKVEKLISVRTGDLEIEIVPTHPIHTPSYKTDYMFLRLSKEIFVSRNSVTEFFLVVPIEVGLFFTGSEIREYFDIFSCKPDCSRYALYGQPETGKLCKFARVVPNAHEQGPSSYVHGRLRVVVENELGVGAPIGRMVFPIRDHDVYYSGSLAAFDDLRMVLKERMGLKIAEMVQQEGTGPAGWARSPRTTEKTSLKFSMEVGFD